uniref:Uncharacterized protein n=1 Tax=Rhizophagus irregularis (strain DAOM 181602 / DAOM 197198 / MUCL 43194) TaxID=747089 RepID=U9SWT0_RHIID
MLLAKYECTNENEFKILLRSLIIGLIIVSERSDLILGINEKIKNWLFDFMTNLILKEHEVKEYKKLVEKRKSKRNIKR